MSENEVVIESQEVPLEEASYVRIQESSRRWQGNGNARDGHGKRA